MTGPLAGFNAAVRGYTVKFRSSSQFSERDAVHSRLALPFVLPALLLGTVGSPAVADPPLPQPAGEPAPAPDLPEQAAPTATEALAEAKELFDGDPASQPATDATMTLLELSESVDDLSGRQRRTAERILARPTSSGPSSPWFETGYGVKEQTPDCSFAHVCVHHVSTTADASDAKWVRTTGAVAEHVWSTIVGGLGYRAPLKDGRVRGDHGPNPKLDIYLTDLGTQGIYGYCTSEDNGRPYRTDPGYCVLDNDYAASQYGARTKPLDVLKVTAAHELFHAVQFGYDWREDAWVMEGTAAWMEEQVYDAINDNRQYLRGSQLTNPGIPLDDPDSGSGYGSWLFFQYLSERHGAGIVRAMWDRLDAAPGAPDQYSAQAVRSTLAARRLRLPTVMSQYAQANLAPASGYSEGAAFRHAPVARSYTLGRRSPRTTVQRLRSAHLSNATVRWQANRTLGGERTLRIKVDLPRTARGFDATVLVHHTDGRTTRRPIRLSRAGDGRAAVEFSRSAVRSLELVLTNASTRFRCGKGTFYSCRGWALDDQSLMSFEAVAVRG